jgi:hypothetical protein
VNLNDLFDRMSTEELDAYAQNGTLPKWFEAATVSTTPGAVRKALSDLGVGVPRYSA